MVEFSKSESGVLVATFQLGISNYYEEYQMVEDLSGVNYIVAHRGQGYFDIYIVTTLAEGRTFGRRAEPSFLKIREKSGFARLFDCNNKYGLYKEVCQGYDYSPFENAFIANIGYEPSRGTRVVIFGNGKILRDETGVLVTNCDKGVILADKVSSPRRYLCWRAGLLRTKTLKSNLVSYDDFYRPRGGFWYRLWKSLFK